MNSQYNTHLWWFELTAICHTSEDQPASICGQQCTQHSWMISYSQVGRSFPFHERNCCVTAFICHIEKTFCSSICNCNTVHIIVCPRLNFNFLIRLMLVRNLDLTVQYMFDTQNSIFFSKCPKLNGHAGNDGWRDGMSYFSNNVHFF